MSLDWLAKAGVKVDPVNLTELLGYGVGLTLVLHLAIMELLT